MKRRAPVPTINQRKDPAQLPHDFLDILAELLAAAVLRELNQNINREGENHNDNSRK